MLDAARRRPQLLANGSAARGTSVRNFLHYLALRTRDVRRLLDDLAELGLSSLDAPSPTYCNGAIDDLTSRRDALAAEAETSSPLRNVG